MGLTTMQSLSIVLLVTFLSGAGMGFSFGVATVQDYANNLISSKYGADLNFFITNCKNDLGLTDFNQSISDFNGFRG